ncbi:hypothetical protein V2S84_27540, partial [Azotobacter chroococcum]|nr:hypothetical protein [Azotobacter chroococcum]
MATVDTVEIPNGDDTTPMLGPQIMEASNQLHRKHLACKVADYTHSRRRATGRQGAPAGGSTPEMPTVRQPVRRLPGLGDRLAGKIPQPEAEQRQHA